MVLSLFAYCALPLNGSIRFCLFAFFLECAVLLLEAQSQTVFSSQG